MQDAATSVATPTGRRTGHRRVAAAIPRVSARGDAAINDEFAAGDETRLVPGKVEGVGGARRRPHQPGDRRHVDDGAAAGRPELRDAVLAAEEHAVEIDRVDATPLLEAGLLDGADGADPGIVDDDIEPAESGGGAPEIGDPILFRRHVVGEKERRAADLAGDLATARLVAIGDRDAGPLLGKAPGDRAPEPRGGAGDEGGFAGEAGHAAGSGTA